MSEKRINEILDRYWAGETSLEEEIVLRGYFAQNSLPAEHERYRTLFGYYAKEAGRKMPESHSQTRIQPHDELKSKSEVKSKTVFVFAIAAAIALLISMSIFFTPQQQAPSHISLTADTFDDPEEAYQEARKALLLVSARLNSGKKFQQEFRPIRRVSEILYPQTSESP